MPSFYDWILYFNPPPHRLKTLLTQPTLTLSMILFIELVDCWSFVRGTCCVLILFKKLITFWFLSSWNLYIDFPSRETDFVHGTCWVLISVCAASGVLFSLFKKLVLSWFFSSWNLNLEFLLVKLILFIDLAAWWFVFVQLLFFCCVLIFLLVKLVASLFFTSWNFQVDFFLVKVIFFIEVVTNRFLSVKLVVCWFSLRENFMFIFLIL